MRTDQVSLFAASTQLPQTLGAKAPAYITMRRHEADGKLRTAMKRRAGSGRPVYSLARLEQIYRDWAVAEQAAAEERKQARSKNQEAANRKPTSAPTPESAPPPLSAAELGALLDAALARHRETLGPSPRPAALIDPELVARQIRETVAQELPTIMRPVLASVEQALARAGELVVVQRALQTKYDAVSSMAREQAESLRAENKALRADADMEMQVQRLRADVANMRDELARLAQLIRASAGTNAGS